MKNFLKYMYILVDTVVVIGFAVFLYFNTGKMVEYTCPIMQKVYTTQLNYLIFVLFIAAYAAGYACNAFIKANVSDMSKAYQKRHENISIANESDKARISTLEAKIETLETALKSALDNK